MESAQGRIRCSLVNVHSCVTAVELRLHKQAHMPRNPIVNAAHYLIAETRTLIAFIVVRVVDGILGMQNVVDQPAANIGLQAPSGKNFAGLHRPPVKRIQRKQVHTVRDVELLHTLIERRGRINRRAVESARNRHHLVGLSEYLVVGEVQTDAPLRCALEKIVCPDAVVRRRLKRLSVPAHVAEDGVRA